MGQIVACKEKKKNFLFDLKCGLYKQKPILTLNWIYKPRPSFILIMNNKKVTVKLQAAKID